MRMEQDGVDVDCLPDNAYCDADARKRSPLEIEECPMLNGICSGNCIHYHED
ncbi:MAG: hypothetical protein HFJ04_01935 [Lachnospiraceae bacterium]|nr:hypothetical protein [Lachnospiraceae bacterium]